MLPTIDRQTTCKVQQAARTFRGRYAVADRTRSTAVAELLNTGEVRRHGRNATKVYARRRKTFADALHEELRDLVEFDMPDGGLAFWLRFRDQELLDRIDARAASKQLWVAPSRSFVAQPGVQRGLRLGFASLNEREAREALRRLRAAARR